MGGGYTLEDTVHLLSDLEGEMPKHNPACMPEVTFTLTEFTTTACTTTGFSTTALTYTSFTTTTVTGGWPGRSRSRSKPFASC